MKSCPKSHIMRFPLTHAQIRESEATIAQGDLDQKQNDRKYEETTRNIHDDGQKKTQNDRQISRRYKRPNPLL